MNAWQRPSFKRALLFAGSLVLVAATARPQCTMTVQFGASSNCGGLNWGATPINGTPPYSAQVSHGGMLLQSLVNVPANMLSGGAAPGGYAAASPGTDILLTDAMGCTVQATAMTPAVHAILPTLVLALDCFTGLGTLRCTGFTDAYAGGSPYAPCDWQGRPCSVAGVAVGTVASTWVNEGGGGWRYGQLLAGGTHNFIFGGTNLACNGALECWGNTLVTVASITPGDCGANVRVRALLQGATVSGVMGDGLRTAGLVPPSEPYSALGYSYVGASPGQNLLSALLTTTGNNAIVDWIVVELRNSLNSAQVLFSEPALLQRDGDVVDLDGDGYVNFPTAGGSYFLAVRHRNHLAIMTALPRMLSPSPDLVDFRYSQTLCYGTTARATVGAFLCLWAGDATGDGQVKYTGATNDRDAILSRIGGAVPTNTATGYFTEDCNLTGVVKYTGAANDRDIILQTIGGTVPTNTRNAQLP